MSETMKPRPLTYSAIQRFKSCRKRYYYEYVLLLRPAEDAAALVFGDLFHRAIETLQNTGSLESATELVYSQDRLFNDPFTIHTIVALLWGYSRCYDGPSEIIDKVVGVETVFSIPIVNPETGRQSLTFCAAGKRDGTVMLHDNRLAFRETKTTREPINDARYWNRLLLDPQVNFYWLSEPDIEACVYDVVHKPNISPLKATPPEKRKYTREGRLYANQRDRDETPDEWRERLYRDIINRPEHYYARREIPRLAQDLHAFRYELWDVAKDIRQAELTGRFYRTVSRNTCDFCPFFNVCAGLESWDGERVPDGFQRIETPNPELERNHDNFDTTDATSAAATVNG